MSHRLFHAFKFERALEAAYNVTSRGKRVLVIDAPEVSGAEELEERLRFATFGHKDDQKIDSSKVIFSEGSLYSEKGLAKILEHLSEGDFPFVLLLNHANPTANLATVLSKTNVISASTKREKFHEESNPNLLYGRPAVPDFKNLTAAQHARFLRDDTMSLDELFPVYDFGAKVTELNDLLAAEIPARAPVILLEGQPLFFEESINEIPAFRGTGKTLFSLYLALLIAAGKSDLSFQVPLKRRVLYVEGELPAKQTQERLKQLIRAIGINVEKGYLSLLAKTLQKRGLEQSPITITTDEGRKEIEAKLIETEANVLFLDSISSLGRFATNDERNWIPVNAWFTSLRDKGITVIFLHQTGKSNEQRGHSISDDVLDLVMKLTSTPGKPSNIADFNVTFPKVREAVTLNPFRLSCTDGAWRVEGKDARIRKAKLTKSEQIRELHKQGASYRQIQDQLKVSSKTIIKALKETDQHDVSNAATDDNPSPATQPD